MNIFVTVGSMLPFDRLVRTMDAWAATHPHIGVFAQIGESQLKPAHIGYCHFISPKDFRNYFMKSDLVVSHVGMGTIITAVECGRPLLLLPRRPDLAEVTSDHQLATARWLLGRPGINIVNTESELANALADASCDGLASKIETGTQPKLINALRQFIEQ